MKTFFVIIVMYVGLAILACQDTHDDLDNRLAEENAYKAVGKEIPFETGIRWMELYKNKNSQTGRSNLLASYAISASETQSMLNSVTGVVGVAFHYGLDMLGQKHIIVIPVDPTLQLWTDIPSRLYVDSNTGNAVSRSTAQDWAQRYKNLHPSDIWFHFFGKNIFDEIATIPYFDSIDIEPAIDDLTLTPQLLLIIWNNQLTTGRSNSEEATIYDASNPCPPCNVQ
jgi:hypothetical protein